MTAPMIRADAPELVALLKAAELLRCNLQAAARFGDEYGAELRVEYDNALAAFRTLAAKPATDALTPWGIKPDGSGLDPATLPIHRGGKASDNV